MYRLTWAESVISSSTSLQYTRSRGWSWIEIYGVEMGRIRTEFRVQGVEMGRFRVYVRWEKLDLDPIPPPGFCVLQWGPSCYVIYFGLFFILNSEQWQFLPVTRLFGCNLSGNSDFALITLQYGTFKVIY